MPEQPRTAPPTDDDRMAAAIALTVEDPSPAARAEGDRLRISRAKPAIVIVTATVVAIAVVVLTGPHGAPQQRSPLPGWRSVVGWTLWCAGLVGIIATWVRRPQSSIRAAFVRTTAVLTAAQRRRITRQVRGRTPVVAAELPVARCFAAAMAGGPVDLLTLSSSVGLIVGQALRSRGWLPWAFLALVAVLVLGSVPAARRQRRQARSFLAAHPAPTVEVTRG